MTKDIQIKEERISSAEYIDFLKRTNLGSQYPQERFESRIAKLVTNVSISLVARNIAVYLIANENAIPFYEKLGMEKADDVMQYNKIEWTSFEVK